MVKTTVVQETMRGTGVEKTQCGLGMLTSLSGQKGEKSGNRGERKWNIRAFWKVS